MDLNSRDGWTASSKGAQEAESKGLRRITSTELLQDVPALASLSPSHLPLDSVLFFLLIYWRREGENRSGTPLVPKCWSSQWFNIRSLVYWQYTSTVQTDTHTRDLHKLYRKKEARAEIWEQSQFASSFFALRLFRMKKFHLLLLTHHSVLFLYVP